MREASGSELVGRLRDRGSAQAGSMPIAHAIWKMDQDLDSQNNERPNIIETQFTKALIRAKKLDMALSLNEDANVRYVLRHDWHSEATAGRSRRDFTTVGRVKVNKWFYELISRRDSLGKKFRRKYEQRTLRLARQITAKSSDFDPGSLKFLFLDPELGTENLAYKFWPEYASLIDEINYREIRMRWGYLVRMEPTSTIEMYVKAWLQSPDSRTFRLVNNLYLLPVAKRRAIYEALLRCVQEQGEMVKRVSGISEQELRDEVLPRLQTAYKRAVRDEARSKMRSESSTKSQEAQP